MFANSLAVGLIGDLFTKLRQAVLTVGILDVGEKLGAFAHQVHAAAQQVTGGSHQSGIDIGHRQHAAAQQDRNFVSVDFVVLRFAAVDGFHVKRMTQDKGDISLAAQVGQPVPGEDALYGDGHVLSVRGNRLEE